MRIFVDFEREVVAALLEPHMAADRVTDVLDSAETVSYERTPVGYYLTVRHPDLPVERLVCNTPLLVGAWNDVECGFVVFVQDGELTLECHSWNGAVIPRDFRQRPVHIEAPEAPT